MVNEQTITIVDESVADGVGLFVHPRHRIPPHQMMLLSEGFLRGRTPISAPTKLRLEDRDIFLNMCAVLPV